MPNFTGKEIFDTAFKSKLIKSVLSDVLKLCIFFGILIFISQYYRIVGIPTSSMYPTLKKGDFVLVDMKYKDFKAGDILGFEAPKGSSYEGDVLIKRLIALPGDTIQTNEGKVYVNGKEISEPYLFETPLFDTEQVVVPENCYYMLGDNRNNSEDSNIYGAVNKESFKGKVVMKIFPRIQKFEE